MRLIDANRLEISKIAEFTDEYGDTVPVYGVMAEDIDKAPTVDAIVLPVKVGQTVWCVIDGFDRVVEGKIYEYTIRGDGLTYFRFTRVGYFTGSAMEDAIGKTVFLTREAAEAAMKARDNNAD